MLKRILGATFIVASLGTASIAADAKPTDPQIAHIAYTAGQIDVTAAEQALKKSKNADVVEFAKTEAEKGRDLVDAALEGASRRLRPILMTSFAFILGCVPLWIASGSGAAGRRILGTVVIVGMLAATSIAIFLIPVTFYVVERLTGKGNVKGAAGHLAGPATGDGLTP